MPRVQKRSTISIGEARLLETFIGQSVRRVATDGWAVFVEISDHWTQFRPEEEAAPDDEHPEATVDRILAAPLEGVAVPMAAREVGADFGIIERLELIATAIRFSPRRKVYFSSIRWEYDVVHLDPCAAPPDAAIVDAGVWIRTDRTEFLISTAGFGHFAFTSLDPNGRKHLQNLEGRVLRVPLSDR